MNSIDVRKSRLTGSACRLVSAPTISLPFLLSVCDPSVSNRFDRRYGYVKYISVHSYAQRREYGPRGLHVSTAQHTEHKDRK